MASVEPHGDDEVGDEVCEGCAFMSLRHQMLQLAVEANKANPGKDIVALAKAFEAYILSEDIDDVKPSGTH